MSGWGVSLVGFGEVVGLLRDLQMQWRGGTLYIVGPTVEYAIYHELGTSKMEARPFVRPAAERVQNDPKRYATEMASTHGIDISTEEGFVRALALAVQNEAKHIADQKDIRDTGDLIASITIEKVS